MRPFAKIYALLAFQEGHLSLFFPKSKNRLWPDHKAHRFHKALSRACRPKRGERFGVIRDSLENAVESFPRLDGFAAKRKVYACQHLVLDNGMGERRTTLWTGKG